MREITTSLIDTYGIAGTLELMIAVIDDKAREAEQKNNKALTEKWDKAGLILTKTSEKIQALNMPEAGSIID